MTAEVLSYKPVFPERGSPTEFQQPDSHQMRHNLYGITGFPSTSSGRDVSTAVLRGSTAALMPPDGSIIFRSPKSDVDILAITEHANAIGAGYFFRNIHLAGQPHPREVHILYFTPQYFQDEQNNPYRTFLTTKLVQPGWTIVNDERHTEYKTQSCEELILRGMDRRQLTTLTPSGAARLVLEENLYAEPWRWTSMRTYFVDSPYRDRQKAQLLYFTNQALDSLTEKGRARNVTGQFRNQQESVYEITGFGNKSYHHRRTDRIRTVWRIIYDPLVIFAFSKQGFLPSKDNFVRLLMKVRSVLANPALSYNCDIIFSH